MHNPPNLRSRESLPHRFDAGGIVVISNDDAKLLDWLSKLRDDSEVSIDLETTGFDPHTCVITMIGLSYDGTNVMVIDPRKFNSKFIKDQMCSLLWNHVTVFHNAKFDLKFLKHNYGIDEYPIRQADCTFIMRKLLTCGLLTKADLATCSWEYLGFGHSKDVREQFLDNEDDATEEMEEYNARDVAITWHLNGVLQRWLEIEDLTQLYTDIERPLIPILADMELEGIDIDREYLIEFDKQLTARLAGFQKDLDRSLIGLNSMPKVKKALLKRDATEDQKERGVTHTLRYADSLNVNAYAKVTEVLNNLGFPVTSSSKEVLAALPFTAETLKAARDKWFDGTFVDDGAPIDVNGELVTVDEWTIKKSLVIVERIQMVKAASKSLNSFIRPLIGPFVNDSKKKHPGFINAATGKTHPRFNQIVRTGRMSSGEGKKQDDVTPRAMNTQQVPNPDREDEGYKARVFEGMNVRKAFTVPVGWELIVFDYEACEFKILAEITGDEGLRYAARQADPHRANAAIMYNKREEDVTKGERLNAKTVMFCVVYGGGAARVATLLRITAARAKVIIGLLLDGFPLLAEWVDARKRMAVESGYAVSMAGRKRYFNVPGFRDRWGRPYERDERRKLIASIERQGQNTPIQATNADITKLSMIRVDMAIRPYGGRLLLQVHDELVAKAPSETAGKCYELMGEAMLSAEREFLETVESKVKGQRGSSWEH